MLSSNIEDLHMKKGATPARGTVDFSLINNATSD
jgi:hypothetical protein